MTMIRHRGRLIAEDPEVALARLEAEMGTIRQVMEERDRLYSERAVASTEAEELALRNLEEYKKASNEWRATMNDVLARMLPRVDFEREHRTVLSRVEELRLGSSERRGKDEVLDQARRSTRWLIALSIGTLLEFAAIVVHLLGK